MGDSPQKFGIPICRQLTKDHVICRTGRRVENIIVSNKTAVPTVFEINAYAPNFYVPTGISGPSHGGRRLFREETYFYLMVIGSSFGNGTGSTGPFYARRGLVLKKTFPSGSGCYATVTLHGVEEGDVQLGKA